MTEKKRPHGAQEYKGNGEHGWEDTGAWSTSRLRVPGGWLYRYGVDGAMTFVPLPACIGYVI